MRPAPPDRFKDLPAILGFAALGFLLAWARFGPGATPAQRWGLYALGLGLFLALAVGCALALSWAARSHPRFRSTPAGLALGLFWVGLAGLDGVAPGRAAALAAGLGLALGLGALVWAWRRPMRGAGLEDAAWAALTAGALLALARSSGAWTWGWSVLGLFGLLGYLALRVLEWDQSLAWTRRPWARVGLGLGVLLLCLPVLLHEDRVHQGFYLSAVNDVLLGRSPLVDVQIQYGPGPVYALAAAFKAGLAPFGLAGVTQLQAYLYLLQTLLLAALIGQAYRTRLLQLAGLLGILVLDRVFSQQHWFVLTLPSMGPLRYGPALLPLLAAWWRLRQAQGSRWLEGAALALAGAWSLETALYACAGYGAWALLERRPWESKTAFKAGGGQIAFAALALGAGTLALSLFTRARAGVWPDWEAYLGFHRFYSSGGVAPHVFGGRGAWLLPLGLTLGSFTAVLLQGAPEGPARRHALLFGAWGALGAVQLSYYAARPHHSILAHLGVPALLCGLYWVDRWRQEPAPQALRCLGAWAILTAFIACGPKLLPGLARQARWTALGQAPSAVADLLRGRTPGAWALWRQNLRGQGPQLDESRSALRLAAKHLDPAGPWTLLLSPAATVEVQLAARVLERSGVCNPEQDAVVEPLRRKIDDLSPYLAGQRALLGDTASQRRSYAGASRFQTGRRQALEKAWILREIDREGTVRVVELVRPR